MGHELTEKQTQEQAEYIREQIKKQVAAESEADTLAKARGKDDERSQATAKRLVQADQEFEAPWQDGQRNDKLAKRELAKIRGMLGLRNDTE